jgi:predicted Rossmann fold nucleotide-binding protein DprA/Smf involved in DNA uptake
MLSISQFILGQPDYPATLQRYMGNLSPAYVQWSGHEPLFHLPKIALFCSVHCPGEALSKSFDLANVLRQNLITVMSGFHSPVEKEWFTLLQRSATPLISCPARGLERKRLTGEEHSLMAQKRLLLINFGFDARRPTKEDALIRNLCMAALADIVVVAFAAPGSKSEYLCKMAARWKKKVYTFADPENVDLLEQGVEVFNVRDLPGFLNAK